MKGGRCQDCGPSQPGVSRLSAGFDKLVLAPIGSVKPKDDEHLSFRSCIHQLHPTLISIATTDATNVAPVVADSQNQVRLFCIDVTTSIKWGSSFHFSGSLVTPGQLDNRSVDENTVRTIPGLIS